MCSTRNDVIGNSGCKDGTYQHATTSRQAGRQAGQPPRSVGVEGGAGCQGRGVLRLFVSLAVVTLEFRMVQVVTDIIRARRSVTIVPCNAERRIVNVHTGPSALQFANIRQRNTAGSRVGMLLMRCVAGAHVFSTEPHPCVLEHRFRLVAKGMVATNPPSAEMSVWNLLQSKCSGWYLAQWAGAGQGAGGGEGVQSGWQTVRVCRTCMRRNQVGGTCVRRCSWEARVTYGIKCASAKQEK